ncbi:MAG: hypothetical protein LUG18_04735 [Candidatus Azobacteroides sp.]|nr:hypothetical protein [Candidatus Azobacteroides sp.]
MKIIKIFIFFWFVPLLVFSQYIDVVQKNNITGLKEQTEFEYLFNPDTEKLTPVAILRAWGKYNISQLFNTVREEANKLGANCFIVTEYVNDDMTSKNSSLTLNVYFAEENILMENDRKKEKNVVYIFGKDKAGKGKTSFKFNGEKTDIPNREFFRYEPEAYENINIKKGGIFGADLQISGVTISNIPVYLTLSGLGVQQTLPFGNEAVERPYNGSAYGIAINTGSIKFMEPALANVLIQVWKKKDNND